MRTSILWAFYVRGTVLSALRDLPHGILIPFHQHSYPHVTAEDAKVQRGEVSWAISWTQMDQLRSGLGKVWSVGQIGPQPVFVNTYWVTAMPIVYVLSKATFVLQWQSWVVIKETIWFTKPYYFLSGPFQKMLAIPAAEHAFLSTTLISRSFVLILHFLFLSFHVHLVTASCQFFLKNVSKVAFLLSSLQLSEVRILFTFPWADKISCSVTSLLPSQALDSSSTDALHPFPYHSTRR